MDPVGAAMPGDPRGHLMLKARAVKVEMALVISEMTRKGKGLTIYRDAVPTSDSVVPRTPCTPCDRGCLLGTHP